MFYNQLAKLCEEKGIKPTPLVKSLGMSTGSIKNWKEGTTPSGDALMRFSEFFNVSIDYLVYGKEYSDMAPDNKISALSEDETDLLAYFRKLPRKEQRQILVQMENTLNKLNSVAAEEEDGTLPGKSLA